MKKIKRFNVMYNVTTSYDADVFAESRKAAIAKVVEVIGEPVRIESVHELPIEVLTREA